jgi:DNA-binding transcriptional LysR family regulator
MDLDLRLVRYFVAVATELHFGRAASSLYISQPALSKQIRRLEDDLGFPLLVRDSRHVVLTPRGELFLDDARQLLAVAERMSRPQDTAVVRMAHVFELDTSRRVVDAFLDACPEIHVIESSMDSVRQLDALLRGQLDVGIIRVTAGLVERYPSGWQHRLLRLEPFWLVGRRGDEPGSQASLRARRVEVFAEGPDSPLYNAHGLYMTAFEQQVGVGLSWLGNPGTYENCLAIVNRLTKPAYLLEFDSYARRYAQDGVPTYRPAELQPVYPWSIAWRAEPPSEPLARFIQIALATAQRSGWLKRRPDMAPLWSPAGDPVAHEIDEYAG